MSVMAKVPEDHPLMQAWTAHKVSEEYANSVKWAAHEKHVDGSLWALFVAGWNARETRASVVEKRLADALRDVLLHGVENPDVGIDDSDAFARAHANARAALAAYDHTNTAVAAMLTAHESRAQAPQMNPQQDGPPNPPVTQGKAQPASVAGWQSIETCPINGNVLFAVRRHKGDPEDCTVCVGYKHQWPSGDIEYQAWLAPIGFMEVSPSKWMPLPAAPQPQAKESE